MNVYPIVMDDLRAWVEGHIPLWMAPFMAKDPWLTCEKGPIKTYP